MKRFNAYRITQNLYEVSKDDTSQNGYESFTIKSFIS